MLRLQTPLPEGYTNATSEDLARRIAAAKETLGVRLMILGHHYQRDEVMCWADARGDSFGLSRLAAAARDAEFVVFCGVHFMAESADVLTGPHQQVILPDLNAGCSMADMADLESVEEAWEELAEVTDIDAVVPITYMNSAAALKAFVGRHGGAVCTSSNARAVLTWALEQHPGRPTSRCCSSPISTSVATPPSSSVIPPAPWRSGTRAATWAASTSGRSRKPASCSGRATARCTSASGPSTWPTSGTGIPTGRVIVHPECSHEVVELADEVGSTDYIIGRSTGRRRARCSASAPRSTWCSGWAPSTRTCGSSRWTR